MATHGIGPFLGLNNILPHTKMAEYQNNGRKSGEYLRSAENVDLTDVNTVRRRQGWVQKLSGVHMHSLFGLADETALVADYQTLWHLSLQGDILHKDALMGDLSPGAPVSYVEHGGEVIFSDGSGIWSLSAGRVKELGIALPSQAPMLHFALDGSMAAGVYQVMFTFRHADGRESGSGEPAQIELPEQSRLLIGNLPTSCPVGVVGVNVYATPPNGDTFYLGGTVGLDGAALDIGVPPQELTRSFTHRLRPMPGGRIVRMHKGRLLTAKGPVLRKSQPYAYGLHDPVADYMPFPADITVLEPVAGGVYVVADKTYFITGDFESVREIQPFGAAFGSAVRRPDGLGVHWFSDRGLVQADEQGVVRQLHSERFRTPKAQEAAVLVREQDGLRQLLAATRGQSGTSAAAASSFMDAQITKEGIFQ